MSTAALWNLTALLAVATWSRAPSTIVFAHVCLLSIVIWLPNIMLMKSCDRSSFLYFNVILWCFNRITPQDFLDHESINVFP